MDNNYAVCEGSIAPAIGLNGLRYFVFCRCLLAILAVLAVFGLGVCLAKEPASTGAFNLSLPALQPYEKSPYHGFARSDGLNYGGFLSFSQTPPGKELAGEPIATGTSEAPKQIMSWETGAGKSYLIPALEIPAFILLLNGVDRLVHPNDVEQGKKVYDTNLSTFWDHVVHGPWGFDQDNFAMNQLLHPYQGSVYYGLARSAGLSYWESSAYTFAGSFLWETAGETTSPSFNDQIASGIAGSFLGEPLFRMASLVLEGDGGKPRL